MERLALFKLHLRKYLHDRFIVTIQDWFENTVIQ